ncbi:MAG: hypothetical protein CL799_02605 [Chromatiales bacterium]|nr:hypothetical protein [Chromatiales bacterium]
MLDLFEDYVKNSDQEKMIKVDIDLDDDLYNKIVAHLETDDSNIISQWISMAIKIVITEYIEKEGEQ